MSFVLDRSCRQYSNCSRSLFFLFQMHLQTHACQYYYTVVFIFYVFFYRQFRFGQQKSLGACPTTTKQRIKHYWKQEKKIIIWSLFCCDCSWFSNFHKIKTMILIAVNWKVWKNLFNISANSHWLLKKKEVQFFFQWKLVNSYLSTNNTKCDSEKTTKWCLKKKHDKYHWSLYCTRKHRYIDRRHAIFMTCTTLVGWKWRALSRK